MNQDEKWMALALEYAEKGGSYVSPNPLVGACLVKKNKLISGGYHKKYGSAHAEIEALKKAGSKAKNATLYVTLEPCSTFGKTPPCTEALIQSGIKKIVIGALDPNPKHHMKSLKLFKKNGLQVKIGVLKESCQDQNKSFFKFITKQMPYVTLKMAQSLDGKIAMANGKSRWITSPTARNYVHHLRKHNDAVMVGKNTLLMDNPKLSPQAIKDRRQNQAKPWRVVLDPRLEVASSARIFTGSQTTLIIASEKMILKNSQLKKLKKRNILFAKEKKGRIDLKSLLKQLAGLGISKLLVEGGGELAWSLVQEGLVDKVSWIIAPKIIGGRLAVTSVEGEGIKDLSKSFMLKNAQVSLLGQDLLYEGYF